MEEFLTTREVASAFGVKPATVREWIKGGKIRSVILNGRHRIPREEFRAYANSLYGSGNISDNERPN